MIGHWELILDGFAQGVRNPAGHGTGAANIATNKIAGTDSRDTENDISNTFVNLGLVGGLLYVAIIVLMFRAVFARYVRRRDALSLAVAGLLVVMPRAVAQRRPVLRSRRCSGFSPGGRRGQSSPRSRSCRRAARRPLPSRPWSASGCESPGRFVTSPRVLLLTPDFPPGRGGIQVLLHRVASLRRA